MTEEDIYETLYNALRDAAEDFFTSKLELAGAEESLASIQFCQSMASLTADSLYREFERVVADIKVAEEQGIARYESYAGLARQEG